MDGDELADAASRGGAGIGRGLDGADIAAREHGDVARADVLLADEHDVGGLDHGIGGFDGADEAASFDHAERVCSHRRFGRNQNRRKANILNSMRQYSYDGPDMMTTPVRADGRRCASRRCVSVAGCSGADTAPPVATVAFTASESRVPLGSPVDLTYRFDVAPGVKIDGDYKVFVHIVRDDGETMWSDDHEPSVPTSQWKPGQTIQYTRTRFVPVTPYLGEVGVDIGLYRDQERLPLQTSDPAEGESTNRPTAPGRCSCCRRQRTSS